METWLKGLVAAACLVVIALGALAGFDRFTAWRAASAIKAEAAQEALDQQCAEATKEAWMTLHIPDNGHQKLAVVLHRCDRQGLLDADLKSELGTDSPLAQIYQAKN